MEKTHRRKQIPMVGYWWLWLCWATHDSVSAHVVLVHPTPRTDNDYLYSFGDGVCNPTTNTCNAFCGDAFDASRNHPVTTLQVGIPTTIYWKTNVAHAPLQYRLSLNLQPSDNNFDNSENILTVVSNTDASFSSNTGSTGFFSTNVTIPVSAVESCTDTPCVLQLWDLYYFVSCADVLLTTENIPAVTDLPLPPPIMSSGNTSNTTLPQTETETTSILVQAASFVDYKVTVGGDDDASSLDPVLYLKRCTTYTFRVDAPGHPFVLKTQPGIGLDNLLDVNSSDYYYIASGSFPTVENGGIEMGTFTFMATEKAPSTTEIYYQCTLHENMVSQIILLDNDDDDDNNNDCGIIITKNNNTDDVIPNATLPINDTYVPNNAAPSRSANVASIISSVYSVGALLLAFLFLSA